MRVIRDTVFSQREASSINSSSPRVKRGNAYARVQVRHLYLGASFTPASQGNPVFRLLIWYNNPIFFTIVFLARVRSHFPASESRARPSRPPRQEIRGNLIFFPPSSLPPLFFTFEKLTRRSFFPLFFPLLTSGGSTHASERASS